MTATASLTPNTSPVRPAAIPAELKERPQWVGWQWEWREGTATKPGKWTKVPVNVTTGGYARSNDPATWATFAAARAYALAHPDAIAGIGFMFDTSDPFTGIDLDKCRAPDTGVIDGWAMSVITALASYAEVSPSGTGVKIIVRAVLAGGGIHRPRPNGIPGGDCEMYNKGRYFAVTGCHVPATPAAIRDAQAAVDALYARLQGDNGSNNYSPSRTLAAPPVPVSLADDALLAKARAATNGTTFTGLWDGGGEDASAGDLALCGVLAFWTGGDTMRIDTLFRQSGRMRPKWDERHRHDGATYGQMTVETACTGRTEYYTPPRTPRSVGRSERDTGRTSTRAGGRFSLRTGGR